MENSEARKRREEANIEEPERMIPVSHVLAYLETIKHHLLMMQDQEAFVYCDLVMNGLEQGEL